MAAAAPARECYRVGDLTIDVGLQRVTGPAGEIALPRLSFALFLVLVRRAPDFVSNDELSSTVWAGLVVTPDTVTKRVNLLREAIGDEASNPRYIAGLRSRGYRITAPVEQIHAEAAVPAPSVGDVAAPAAAHALDQDPTSSATATVNPAVTWKPSTRLIAAIAVLGLVFAAAWWASAKRQASDSQQLRPASALPTADRSVAVLRFRNLSADPADAYLAAGVPEMILDRLATVPGLTVIASGSALGIESGAMPPAEAATRLGARYLVEGSAQREGAALRVTARLIDSTSATQVWSTREDRTLDELFLLQDAIATSVATELASRITGLAPLRPAAPSTPMMEAQLAFLQGRALLTRGTVAGSLAAVGKFEQATTLDPRFAAAYAGLYDASMLAAERRHEARDSKRGKRESLIEQALALDPNCGSAYVARAMWSDGVNSQREADFTRGLELDPSNSRGLLAFSAYLERAGRYDEARRMLDRALQVDPMSPAVHFTLVQRRFRTEGGLSLEQGMRRVLDIDPDYQPALQRYAKYRWMHHAKLADAAQIIGHAIQVDPDNPWSRHTAAAIFLDLGDATTAKRIAAGTDSSRDTAQILLSLQAGDWRAAGEAALSEPGRRYNRFESWGVPEAARDYALQTGDTARVIQFFEQRYGLREGAKLDLSNFRAAAYLAQLLPRAGQVDRANRLLAILPDAITATIAKDGSVYSLRTIASVRMLQGDRQGALNALAESFRAEDLMQWWYTIERDPLWEPVRQSTEFQAIAREVRARVAHEQSSLAELRGSGKAVAERSGAQRP